MPELAQIVEGVQKKWILKDCLNKGEDKDVWSAYDFSQYLIKAGLDPDNITVNAMTRARFLQECQFILGEPKYTVRFLTDPGHIAFERFTQGINVLEKINDPRVVTIFDHMLKISEEEPKAGTQGGFPTGFPAGFPMQPAADETEEEEEILPFYVMEKIEGVLLEQKAGKERAYEGKITDSLALMREIAGALVSAHKAGIVHSDLNPKNIFVRDDGTPVLIDFGICQFIEGRRHSLTGECSAQMNFIAPELTTPIVAEECISPANDIYTIGKLLYYLIAGGKSLPQERHHDEALDLRKKYPSRLMDLVYRIFDRTIIRNMGDRVQSIDDLLTMINREMIEGTRCIYCRVGTYMPVMRALLAGHGDDRENTAGQYEAKPFVCNKCGNVQYFSDTAIIREELSG